MGTMMLQNQVHNHLGKAGLLAEPDTVSHMVDNEIGTFLRLQDVMRILAIKLVFNKKDLGSIQTFLTSVLNNRTLNLKGKILFIEDQQSVADATVAIFESYQAEIDHVLNLSQAKELFSNDYYDLFKMALKHFSESFLTNRCASISPLLRIPITATPAGCWPEKPSTASMRPWRPFPAA